MIIDIPTLLVAAGAVVAIAGVAFIASTALGRNERYGRIWSIAFIAGMLETVASVVWILSPAGWWAGPVANGALVLAIGLVWAGCREYNGRRSLALVPVVVGNLVAVLELLQGPDAGPWAGAVQSFVCIVIFSALASLEALRGRLRTTIDARILSVVFGIVAAYYLLRLVIFLVAGSESVAFTQYVGTGTTTFIAMALVVVGAISMTAIQPPGETRKGDLSGTARGFTIDGVVDAAQFEHQASDWLRRARRDKDSLVLLTLSVDGLEHLNSAFGREFGDQAITAVGRIACEHSPAAALVAHTGGGRFTILSSAPSFGPAVTIAERLQTALVETPVDPAKGIRAIIACGVATTDTSGYDLLTLGNAAYDALTKARADSRPGTIVLAGS